MEGKKVIVQNSGTAGIFWVMGWLFTIGFLKLTFWNGVLAIIVWPYYLGAFFSAIKL